jgi:hypothetical protein
VQAANGLGQHISALTDNQIVTYQKVCAPKLLLTSSPLNLRKAEYANKLLYIATLVFAKLSIISLLMILTASDLHRNLGIGLTGIIALWGFISEFVAAFSCGSSEPWRFINSGHGCLDMVGTRSPSHHRTMLTVLKTSFWLSMGVFNILTDLALILFPVHVIVTLQMSLGKKIAILVFFGARSL